MPEINLSQDNIKTILGALGRTAHEIVHRYPAAKTYRLYAELRSAVSTITNIEDEHTLDQILEHHGETLDTAIQDLKPRKK